MYFSFGLLTLPFALCDEVPHSRRFYFLYLTPISASWHSKTDISKGIVDSKLQTFSKFNTFWTWNHNAVHKVHTDTVGLSVKCLLLTSYFSTLLGQTQQNTAVDSFVLESNPFQTVSWFIQSLVMNSVSVSSENKEVEFTCVVPPLWMWKRALCIKELLLLSSIYLSPFNRSRWKCVHILTFSSQFLYFISSLLRKLCFLVLLLLSLLWLIWPKQFGKTTFLGLWWLQK